MPHSMKYPTTSAFEWCLRPRSAAARGTVEVAATAAISARTSPTRLNLFIVFLLRVTASSGQDHYRKGELFTPPDRCQVVLVGNTTEPPPTGDTSPCQARGHWLEETVRRPGALRSRG